MNKPASEQNARFAIDAAIDFGRQGVNPPPTDDHWLMPYWEIGRKLADVESAKPYAWTMTGSGRWQLTYDAEAAAAWRKAGVDVVALYTRSASDSQGGNITEQERLRKWAKWIVRQKAYVDHACIKCKPNGNAIKPGFVCTFHDACDFLASDRPSQEN